MKAFASGRTAGILWAAAAVAALALAIITPSAPWPAYRGALRRLPRLGGNGNMTTGRTIDITGKSAAPELTGAVAWLNVDAPLSLKQLRGKVVLLDFWTYCCINCMHVIPDLKALEVKYGSHLVVIGIHSAKFTNEKESDNIRQAMLRYDVEHPVANDASFAIWRRYGVRAWPTMVLIDPEGKIVGGVSGENVYDVLDQAIGSLVEKFAGTLDDAPIALSLERDRMPPTFLRYPGKVLADAEGGRLFIADTSHNRIVVTNFEGRLLMTIGSGAQGRSDGKLAEAEFHHPQGMALDGAALYLADTGNHLLRRIDLDAGTVSTVAGTGARQPARKGGPALETPLNSPWDLTVVESSGPVYIAMAGSHQIWMYHPDAGTVEPLAGSGQENIVDGPTVTAALAQPSGITTDGHDLYFADSEASALRMIEIFGGRRVVKTLIGKGLFDFGDKDGPFATALLQHPQGVAYSHGKLYVADTYNHKIKVVDLAAKTIETLAGTRDPWVTKREFAQFSEPGGVSVARGRVYVADTNNHAIRFVDLATGSVGNFTIITASETAPFEVPPEAAVLDLGDRALPARGIVAIELVFPEGLVLNPDAEPVAQLRVTLEGADSKTMPRFVPENVGTSLLLRLETGELAAPARVEAVVTFYYCREGEEATCYIGTVAFEGQLEDSDVTLSLVHEVSH